MLAERDACHAAQADKEYHRQYRQAMVGTLLNSGALFCDPEGRMFVPGTGFPHVCRIDIDRCSTDDLLSIAQQYALFIKRPLVLTGVYGSAKGSPMLLPTAGRLACSRTRCSGAGQRMASRRLSSSCRRNAQA